MPPRSRAGGDSLWEAADYNGDTHAPARVEVFVRGSIYLHACILFGAEVIHDAAVLSLQSVLPGSPPSLLLQEINRQLPLMR